MSGFGGGLGSTFGSGLGTGFCAACGGSGLGAGLGASGGVHSSATTGAGGFVFQLIAKKSTAMRSACTPTESANETVLRESDRVIGRMG
jgi:hypothetical protein